MIGTVTLPAIALLAAISGLPGLKGLPMPATKEHARAKAAAVAADTLPPPWRPAWRVALDSQFVTFGLRPIGRPYGPIKLLPAYDPRKVRVSVDPDSGAYRSRTEVGEVTLGVGYRRRLEDFAREYSMQNLRERWQERSRRDLNNLGANTPIQRTGISVPLPVRLPQRVQSILGPGAPSLNISGSESIRLSGTSNWTNQKLGLVGQRQSLFPSLDMQQDLDIRLEGQLSDRIKVNLLQNSANQVPLANRIAINYRGDEDDFIQALDLGNTSLALPGTQFVSYSGKNDGLFGIKLAARIAALDFTALASKQEGRSERAVYSGGASRGQNKFTDLDWVKGQYFLLYDPNFGTVYDIKDQDITLYLDDANATNNNAEGVLSAKAVLEPDSVESLRLSPLQQAAGVRGSFNRLRSGPDGQYEVLNNFYAFHDTIYKVIRLKQPIQVNSDQVLAVSFVGRRVIAPGYTLGSADSIGGRVFTTPGRPDSTILKLLRAPRNLQVAKQGAAAYDDSAAFGPVRELELKNVYNLGGYGLDPKSFKLTLQRGQGEPPVTAVDGVPLIELLGLDNWDEQTGQPRAGQDGEVDGYGFNSQTRGWVDYANGLLFLPDPRPFAPRLTNPAARAFDQFLDNQLRRRKRLDGTAGSLQEPNPDAYELRNPLLNDAQFYFVAEFAAARSGGSDITLGRGNILDGSEAVVVNGERWQRDRDYSIDYDLGRITMKRQLGPSDQLSIDYSYAPLFAQASKTLIGSAFRLEGRDRSAGGAFLYESKGAQDLRPRLGEEPSRTLITDLNTDWRFKPSFLTRFADALPGVRTTTPSEFNIQAEAGMSFPNPNTRNEVYIDDMEGVRDAVSLALTPDRWRWASVPSRGTPVNGVATNVRSLLEFADSEPVGTRPLNAEVRWFQPFNANGTQIQDEWHMKERDLRPKLVDAQGGGNLRTTLGISIPRRPAGFTAPGNKLWAGLMYTLDPTGLDLSRSQFIELWVNDWADRRDGPLSPVSGLVRGNGSPASSVKLHIDLGRVSEDQMRAPNRRPNGFIDTEDQKPRDNQLAVIGDKTEDIGIDNLKDQGERDSLNAGRLTLADLLTASATDPEGDNYGDPIDSYTAPIDARRWQGINGTEGNNRAYPLPNTEDLNLDEKLDTAEDYFEYTIDLGDPASPYLQDEVIKALPTNVVTNANNGWRRYRIPITDEARVRFGFPDLTLSRHVRIWIENLSDAEVQPNTTPSIEYPLLMLGGVEIVGSRWQSEPLTATQADVQKTTLTLNSVNSVDNAEYVLPFDPGDTRDGNAGFKRREQSISLEFERLHPRNSVEAFKTFSLPENYSRYGVLRWWASGFDVRRLDAAGNDLGRYDPAQDSLYYFVRFASDDKGANYYEIRRRFPKLTVAIDTSGWEQVAAEIEKLSAVKLDPAFPVRDPVLYTTRLANGDLLTVKGRPSFTRLLRVSFGVVNTDSLRDYRYSGQLWFNEMRATDVAKDVGVASRVLMNGRWANLMDYNVAWNSRDADFLSVGETRGSGNRNSSLNVSTRFEPHRFFEGTGILLPLSFTQNETSSQPRFTAGDDIVRTGALASASESKTVSRNMTASYSRQWSDRSNKFLRYTLGGVTANISRSTSDSRSPTALNKTSNVTAGVTYQITPRELLRIPLPFTKTRFYPLPERAYWNYGVSNTRSNAFTRTFGSGDLLPSSSQNGRSANVDFGADTRPFDLLSHHIDGRRNLALDGVRLDHVGFINFGRVINWRQSFSSHLALSPSPWFRPSFNWSSNYSQNNDTQSRDIGTRSISNGQELGVTWDLPFDRLTGTGMAAARAPVKPDTGAGGTARARPRRLLLPWRPLLARLGAISTDGRIGRTSGYSRIQGTASPLYLIGLAENPGFDDGRVLAEAGNTSSSGLDLRGNARTTIPLAFGSSLQARSSYGDRTNNNNGVVQRNRDWRFPDFEVQYGRVANLLGLTHILDSPQLRTSYARSYSVDYQNSRSVRTGTSRSDEFRPLVSVRGRLRNGTDADLRFERRSSVRESFLLGTSTATDRTTNVNFSLSRSYSQGQKMKVLGKTTTVNRNVSMQLTTTYERQKGGIKVPNETNLANPVDRTRLSVNTTGSMGFSTNVTADLALGFSHFRETNGIIRRSIRMELRGQYRF